MGTLTALRVLSELEEERDDLFPIGFKRIASVFGVVEFSNVDLAAAAGDESNRVEIGTLFVSNKVGSVTEAYIKDTDETASC